MIDGLEGSGSAEVLLIPGCLSTSSGRAALILSDLAAGLEKRYVAWSW